jgi:hypothetical protein
MTDILTALKECADNPIMNLTRQECKEAHDELLLKIANIEFLHAELNDNEDIISSLQDEIDAFTSKPISPIVNAINWLGRWSIFFVAGVSSYFIVTTWQWNDQYYADALAAISVFVHAGFMLFKWWTK